MSSNNVFSQGKENLKSTPEFQQKLKELQNEIRNDFQQKTDNQSNFLKKQILKIKREIRLRNAVNELNSDKNLHNNKLVLE